MKIACISNSNNFFFTLCRYLRDKGLDAELLCMPNEGPDTFHHPSVDCFDDTYKNYTREISWGESSSKVFSQFLLGDRKIQQTVTHDLSEYDFLIGTQLSPAYCAMSGLTLDIQFPMGADTREFPYLHLPKRGGLKGGFIEYNIRSRFQRKGIRNARHLISGLNASEQLKRLNPKGQIIDIPFPTVYTGLYNEHTLSQFQTKSKNYQAFKALRDRCDIMLFSQNRQWWWGYGNEILLHGLKIFTDRHPQLRVKLVMFEYGQEVDRSKKLVQDIGLNDYIAWFPAMPRKELMMGLSMADVGINELSMSWVMAGSIFECLAMAKPLIQYREDEQYKDLFPELPPIANAQGPEAVAMQLENYVHNQESFKLLGNAGKAWYEKYVVQHSIDTICKLITHP